MHEIGRGAMGIVYKGHDPVIQRPVAIKTIHKQLGAEDPSGTSAAARFRNEAQAVGRLLHPGIVAIYEYGEDEDTAYIAMELVQGRTLSHSAGADAEHRRIDRRGRVDRRAAAVREVDPGMDMRVVRALVRVRRLEGEAIRDSILSVSGKLGGHIRSAPSLV